MKEKTSGGCAPEGKCDPCEATFQENIQHLVREGEGPTDQMHRQVAREVETAFDASPSDNPR